MSIKRGNEPMNRWAYVQFCWGWRCCQCVPERPPDTSPRPWVGSPAGRPSTAHGPGWSSVHSTTSARDTSRLPAIIIIIAMKSIYTRHARRSLSTVGGDTQWPINPPLLSSSHSPSSPAERCKVSQQVWNRVMNWTWTCVSSTATFLIRLQGPNDSLH